MKRRIISLFLIVTIVFSSFSLAGCGGLSHHYTGETFTAVKFTGKTQEGRPIEFDFSLEDAENMRDLINECSEILEKGEDIDAFENTLDAVTALSTKLNAAKEDADLYFKINTPLSVSKLFSFTHLCKMTFYAIIYI